MAKSQEISNGEAGMPGAFFGGIIGGCAAGSAADLTHAVMSSMGWYAIGVVVGAAIGWVAATNLAKRL